MRTLTFSSSGGECRNPTLRQVWGWNSHSQKWELGILWDSRNFIIRLQRSKHLALRCYLYLWKALEESYKLSLDLIPIRGLSRELWAPKVPRVQPGTVSGLLLGSPGNKSHSNASAAEQRKEYYMGEGDASPSPGRGESSEFVLPMACPNTKSVSEGELTNLWLVLMQDWITK